MINNSNKNYKLNVINDLCNKHEIIYQFCNVFSLYS